MDADSFREAIYDAFAGTAERETKIARALGVGTDYLGLSVGILTRIDDGTQEVMQAVGGENVLEEGETCPLERAYCRRTVEIDGPLAVQNAADADAISDAAYRTFELGTYLGTKVRVNDDVYGTVCFADEKERATPFTEAEEVSIELLAKLVGQELERRAYERELEQRNERLEREKQRFEGIAETSFDVLFRVGRDAEFTYVSAAVERVLGHEPETLVGDPFTDHLDSSSVGDAHDAYVAVFDGETVESLELEFLDADGAVVVLEVNAAPIHEDGEVVGAQGVGRDVTARKERERELRVKNRAMDEARIGISIADDRVPDQPLVYVNEGFERITGYDAEDALGRNCRFLQGPATDADAVERFRERIDAREPTATELVNYRADGTPFWNRVRVGPVEDETGEVTHYVGFQADVTERKRGEQLGALLNRVLRHNLSNDMNVILGWAELLAADEATDPAAVGSRIRRTAERLVDLSRQARELQRDARRSREHRRLDADALLRGVAETHRNRFPDAAVDVSVRTGRDVCAGVELERAVSELVENVLKHDPAPEPWVGLTAVDDGEWVEVTVADEGPGIDAIETEIVAEGEETALEHGSGLGLWAVNWIVTRYGGSFQIRAREGAGTVATIRLPGIDADTPVEAVARRPTILSR
ncbi:MAG: PAS domain S-box protein [Haloplanus sp.]